MFEQLTDPKKLLTLAVIAFVVMIVLLLQQRRKNKPENKSEYHPGHGILDQYSTNYTQLARQGKLEPVIGRQREVEHLIQVLSRKTKNNALLLGEPGVGKTAVVERLALMIVNKQVPDSIAGQEIIALDMASLVSGTKYRGELEQRLDELRKEFHERQNSIILFIDELQELAQAKGAEGGLSPGDILKPELARGTLQVIGATTLDEYEKYIIPEESLERRFQPVYIHEPSREETLQMLQGVRDVFGKYHHVQYSDKALEAIIDLSKKYIHKRYLPDKAIDILDEAGVRARLDHLKLKRQNQKPAEESVLVDVDTVKQIVSEWAEIPIAKLKIEE
ncbi:MAG: AAA family ATPase [Patescibacteria group bacterium]|jgi:ATP-dependent Clp protease ATP-binding subunit ClpC